MQKWASGTYRRAAVLLALGATYVVSGQLGLKLAYAIPPVSPLWAPTGLALAAFMTIGYRIWPVVLLASFIVHDLASGNWSAALLIAAGDTAQTAVTAYLVNRFAGGREVFRRSTHVIRFTALIAPWSAVLGATLATVLPGIAGLAPFNVITWVTWCLGELAGTLVFTPFVVLWVTGSWRRGWFQTAEFLTLLAMLVPTCLAVFAGTTPFADPHFPLQILCVPFLMWAAFRLGRRETATVVVILTVIAAYGTSIGMGPFVRTTPLESFLLLQLYVGIWSIMTMALAAVVSEHAHAERLAKALATTDPLTGLANYRELVRELDVEITRSERTGRRFSIVFVDLNGLKTINDSLGHLVGNQALARVAGVLQRTCRAMDMAARFGGDEFVVVLPETDRTGAEVVARRVARNVAADGRLPPLSVSTGVAEYPRDGRSAPLLLDAADGALYRAKRGLRRSG